MIDNSLALHLIALRGGVVVGPVAMDREERAWIARAMQGEETAFRWLINRYRDRVIRIASATLGGTSEAEDAAQEAFIRAFRGLGRLEQTTSFYGWLSRITVRVCLDQKRLKRTQEVSLEMSDRLSVCSDCSAKTEKSLAVWQILNQLTPPMRAALVLRELDGLEYDEIARLLQVPVGTVRSRLNTARTRFRELWQASNSNAESVQQNDRS